MHFLISAKCEAVLHYSKSQWVEWRGSCALALCVGTGPVCVHWHCVCAWPCVCTLALCVCTGPVCVHGTVCVHWPCVCVLVLCVCTGTVCVHGPVCVHWPCVCAWHCVYALALCVCTGTVCAWHCVCALALCVCMAGLLAGCSPSAIGPRVDRRVVSMSSAMWNRDGTLSYDSRDQPAQDQSGECLE